jgi:hypothetical protein
LTPAVQFLRGFRDQTVYSTFAGSQFMTVFNRFYYSFSPTVALLISGNEFSQEIMQVILYPLIGILHLASMVYSIFSFIPELAVVLAGLISSSLIGVVYLTPLFLILSRNKKIQKQILKKVRSGMIIVGSCLILVVIANIVSSPIIMMFAAGILVLSTLSSTAVFTSKEIIKLVQKRT